MHGRGSVSCAQAVDMGRRAPTVHALVLVLGDEGRLQHTPGRLGLGRHDRRVPHEEPVAPTEWEKDALAFPLGHDQAQYVSEHGVDVVDAPQLLNGDQAVVAVGDAHVTDEHLMPSSGRVTALQQDVSDPLALQHGPEPLHDVVTRASVAEVGGSVVQVEGRAGVDRPRYVARTTRDAPGSSWFQNQGSSGGAPCTAPLGGGAGVYRAARLDAVYCRVVPALALELSPSSSTVRERQSSSLPRATPQA